MKNLPIQFKRFTEKELQIIQAYEEAGLPGIGRIDETLIARMTDLYLSGKTFNQICRYTQTKKDIILYLAKKFDLPAKREEYMRDLEDTLVDRTMEAKIISQDFVIQIKQFLEKKIGNKMTKYLVSGNEEVAEEVDLKEISGYLKTLETFDKLTSERKSERSPAVGLNLGDGVTVKSVGTNEIEITPKQKTVASMLEEFADFRRKEESKPKPTGQNDTSDINKESTKQGENNENS